MNTLLIRSEGIYMLWCVSLIFHMSSSVCQITQPDEVFEMAMQRLRAFPSTLSSVSSDVSPAMPSVSMESTSSLSLYTSKDYHLVLSLAFRPVKGPVSIIDKLFCSRGIFRKRCNAKTDSNIQCCTGILYKAYRRFNFRPDTFCNNTCVIFVSRWEDYCKLLSSIPCRDVNYPNTSPYNTGRCVR